MKKFNFNIDSIEDNIDSLSKSSIVYNSQKHAYEEDLYLVDLNLPSGTKWCKYNLGVDPNKLTKSKTWYGKYYAWGEIKSKKEYSWETYKHANNVYDKLTKYCTDSVYGNNGFTDDFTELQLEDDAAYQNMQIGNLKFRIPNKEQFKELLEYTTNKWIKNYQDIDNLNGCMLISKFNDKELFIPATGYSSYSNLYNISSNGCYWSSTLDTNDPYYACGLNFDSEGINYDNYYRCIGFNIRYILIKQ